MDSQPLIDVQPCHACATFSARVAVGFAGLLGGSPGPARGRRRHYRAPHGVQQVGHQHVPRERGLARAGHAGNRHQTRQRNPRRDMAQVMQMRTLHGQPLRRLGFPARARRPHRAARLQRMDDRPRQELARGGVRCGGQRRHPALRHEMPAALAGAGANIDDVVGTADGVLVMLHHHQRVALVAKLAQGVQQDLVVARMQADGRLVQHVAHALQVAAELRRQADALRLAAREARRGAVQAQVAQPHFLQELQAAGDLRRPRRARSPHRGP